MAGANANGPKVGARVQIACVQAAFAVPEHGHFAAIGRQNKVPRQNIFNAARALRRQDMGAAGKAGDAHRAQLPWRRCQVGRKANDGNALAARKVQYRIPIAVIRNLDIPSLDPNPKHIQDLEETVMELKHANETRELRANTTRSMMTESATKTALQGMQTLLKGTTRKLLVSRLL